MNISDIQKKWVEALRSGEYRQGEGYLQDHEGKFCCLGVACEIFSLEYHHSDSFLPSEAIPRLKLRDEAGDIFSSLAVEELEKYLVTEEDKRIYRNACEDGYAYTDLAQINDNGYSFKMIANIIENESERIFKHEETDTH